jgi:hypothetical protein
MLCVIAREDFWLMPKRPTVAIPSKNVSSRPRTPQADEWRDPSTEFTLSVVEGVGMTRKDFIEIIFQYLLAMAVFLPIIACKVLIYNYSISKIFCQ